MIFCFGGIGESLVVVISSKVECCGVFYSQIFPTHSSSKRPITKDSALAKIKEKRAAQRLAAALGPSN
jgi:hypothetical protein